MKKSGGGAVTFIRIFALLMMIDSSMLIYYSNTLPQNAYTSIQSQEMGMLKTNSDFQRILHLPIQVLEVSGIHVKDSKDSVIITLDAADKGMNFAERQVLFTLKELNRQDLDRFSNISIVVKVDTVDGNKRSAIKSDWNPKIVMSDEVKRIRHKNIDQVATSWWQINN